MSEEETVVELETQTPEVVVEPVATQEVVKCVLTGNPLAQQDVFIYEASNKNKVFMSVQETERLIQSYVHSKEVLQARMNGRREGFVAVVKELEELKKDKGELTADGLLDLYEDALKTNGLGELLNQVKGISTSSSPSVKTE